MRVASPHQPRISVLIPVRNAAGYLARCLESLRASAYANFECIVADDASTDDSAAIAEANGCHVLGLAENVGPAEARNRATEQASGEILFFVDADVCVARDSLSRIAKAFREDPQLDALIGSYDDEPAAPGLLSQYKNLLHHYTHQQASESATTFWSGCGAIRRRSLLLAGGFCSDYRRPATEDIELGYRLRAAGCKIRLDKQLQVKHLKAWSFWKMVKTDVLDRGLPWMELLLRYRHMPSDLNLRPSQRGSVVLIYVALLSTAAGVTLLDAAAGTPLLVLAALLLILLFFLNLPFYRFLANRRGIAFSVAAVPLHWVYHFYNGISFCAGVLLYATRRSAPRAKPAQDPAPAE